MTPTVQSAGTEDGITVALTRYAADVTRSAPVVLTHGTFSNGGLCARLAAYLAQDGFDCWVLELGGHGASQRDGYRPDFEAFGLYDVPAAIDAVRQHTGRPQVFLVRHSAGGLAFLMHLARRPAAQREVAGGHHARQPGHGRLHDLARVASRARRAGRHGPARLLGGSGLAARPRRMSARESSTPGSAGTAPKTAKAIGLTIPPSVLTRADEIIQWLRDRIRRGLRSAARSGPFQSGHGGPGLRGARGQRVTGCSARSGGLMSYGPDVRCPAGARPCWTSR